MGGRHEEGDYETQTRKAVQEEGREPHVIFELVKATKNDLENVRATNNLSEPGVRMHEVK